MAPRYPLATWNPVPESCFTRRVTKKIALCSHRMVGFAGYMRTPHPEAVRRRISAHMTFGMDGSVEQHVDFDHIAHTQGIKQDQYAYARKNWPLFQERNPNSDVIGLEYEDGGKAFTAERPMPSVQLDAIVKAHKWLLENVIKRKAIHGVTEISHDMLTTNRSQDPGDWVMNTLMDALAGAGSFDPHPASQEYQPRTVVRPKRALRQSKHRLRKMILSGKRRCTFNDAVTLGWIEGDEAAQFSRRVWHTLRKYGHSPLAPWSDGEHLYGAICGTLRFESGLNPKAVNDNLDGPIPGGGTGPSADRGLAQINDQWWPNVTDEQAFSPAFAIDFMVKHFPEHSEWWHGYGAYLRHKRSRR